MSKREHIIEFYINTTPLYAYAACPLPQWLVQKLSNWLRVGRPPRKCLHDLASRRGPKSSKHGQIHRPRLHKPGSKLDLPLPKMLHCEPVPSVRTTGDPLVPKDNRTPYPKVVFCPVGPGNRVGDFPKSPFLIKCSWSIAGGFQSLPRYRIRR